MTSAHSDVPRPTYEQFEREMRAAGFDEVLVRTWAPATELAAHSHPFQASALIVQGEMWLRVNGGTVQHLQAGDRFELAANTLHDERYGSDGATYWVARRRA